MSLAAAFKASSSLLSWKSTGKLQQTLAKCIERTGKGLHSGNPATVTILPASAGNGRSFKVGGGRGSSTDSSLIIPASVEFSVKTSLLCTTLSKDGYSVRTVEHLLSALEGCGVDNCTVHVTNTGADDDRSIEIPILDGSAIEWVDAIEQAGLEVARDKSGNSQEKMAPFINEPVHVQNDDSFLVALPSSSTQFSYGINFQQVEQMHKAGLARGGSLENAIVCSSSRGWLNPPLRFMDEPCRHKVLDLIGDFSLLARCGSQGLPVAHIIAYKGGHALHTDFLRRLVS